MDVLNTKYRDVRPALSVYVWVPQIANSRFGYLDPWIPSGIHICRVTQRFSNYTYVILNLFQMHTHIVRARVYVCAYMYECVTGIILTGHLIGKC
jgi:hypothetical protein